jgi:hypothetical protein
MIIDLLNAKNKERAVAFLDQEKAFDMVSFTTINTIFTKLSWPERFKSLLATVYKENRRSTPTEPRLPMTLQSTRAPDKAAHYHHSFMRW